MKFKTLTLCLLALSPTIARADGYVVGDGTEQATTAQPTGLIDVAFGGYHIDRPHIDRSRYRAGHWREHHEANYRRVMLGWRLSDEVSADAVRSGRFNVHAMQRARIPFLVTPETKPEYFDTHTERVQYFTGGDINLNYDFSESEQKRKDKKYIVHNVMLQATVLHTAKDARTGVIWRQLEAKKTISRTFDDRPDEEDLEDMAFEACRDGALDFVRQLVPAAEGQIIGKEGTHVLINLGKANGVGGDVDFAFYRIADVLDNNGQAIADPATGQPLRRKTAIALRPTENNKNPLPCVGRAAEINDTFTSVTVGYNGSGGFFGPDIKFKEANAYFDELRKGDIVVMTPRPPGAK